MKKQFIKRAASAVITITMLISLTACGDKEKNNTTENLDIVQDIGDGEDYEVQYDEYVSADCGVEECYNVIYDYNTNEYNYVGDNSWMSVADTPLSTFAADVDTASYTQIMNCEIGMVPENMVRIEEMINYFHYDYPAPEGDDRFAVYTEYMECPWNIEHKLALVALNTEPIDFSDAPSSNLVFLIDTSGSMFGDDRLGLLQQAFCMLAENLDEYDRVSIVTYAGSDSVELEGARGDEYYEITSVIENLEAYGSTNGSAGINTAYEIAEEYFIEGGNNRVILATDGDLNVGVTSEEGLIKLIEEKKETGIYLSVIGVGDGNYKDNKLESLADKGNGNYSYLSDIFDAKKALVDELGANMVTVAKDVKLQVEFDENQVSEYRLIGYENRVMNEQDFNDDSKDGGEMGAGHSVTVLYEIVPAENFGKSALFTLNVRYKEPDGNESMLETFDCTTKESVTGSDNIRWAAAVAAYGMYLKNSEYRGDVNLELIEKLACSTSYQEDEYRINFVNRIYDEKEEKVDFTQ